jgi:hypothetical protein
MTQPYRTLLATIIAQKKNLDGLTLARDQAAHAAAQREAADLLRCREQWRTHHLPLLQNALHDVNDALEEVRIHLRDIPQRGPEPFISSVLFVLFINGQPQGAKLRIGFDRAGVLTVQRLDPREKLLELLPATGLDEEVSGRLLTAFVSSICTEHFGRL